MTSDPELHAKLDLLLGEVRQLHDATLSLPLVLKPWEAALQLGMGTTELKRLVSDGKIGTCDPKGAGRYGIPRSEVLRLAVPRFAGRPHRRAGGRPAAPARAAASAKEQISEALRAERRSVR